MGTPKTRSLCAVPRESLPGVLLECFAGSCIAYEFTTRRESLIRRVLLVPCSSCRSRACDYVSCGALPAEVKTMFFDLGCLQLIIYYALSVPPF